MAGKYFWLRLPKDFFKRHDILVLESMPNGKDYSLFYIKMLVESISHEGYLRFSETIPYNPEMLAVITNTNVDVVRSAVKVLQELKLLEVMDNKTLYLTEVNKMIGGETEWAEKKRQQRARALALATTSAGENIPQISDKTTNENEPVSITSQENTEKVDKKRTKKDNVRQYIYKESYLEKEKELNTEIKDERKKGKKDPTTPHPEKKAYGLYKHVLLTDDEYNDLAKHYEKHYLDYIEAIDLYVESNKKAHGYKNYKAAILAWMRKDKIKPKVIKKAEFDENGDLK